MKRSFSQRIYVLVIALMLLFVAGCTPSVVGKWQGDIAMQDGQKIPVQIEFKQDGSLLQTLSNVNYNGTYTVDGDKMTMNLTEANLAGKKIPFNGMGAASGNVTIKFEGEKLVLTGEQPLVLERTPE